MGFLSIAMATTYHKSKAIDVTLFPRWNAVVFHNADFFVKIIEPVHNMVRCTLKLVVGSEMVLLQSGTEDTNDAEDFMYWGKGLSSGECGARAHKVQPSSGGKWKLSATNSTGTFSGIVTVTVYSDVEEIESGGSLMLGEWGSVKLGSPEHGSYCYLRSPSGQELNVRGKYCHETSSHVTKADAGQWVAVYGIEGSMLEQQTSATYMLTEKVKGIQASVEMTKSGAINLLCRLHNFATNVRAEFCRFVRPDGTGLHVTDGIGDGYYSYFGNGLNGNGLNKETKDCGITIDSPTEQDYGTWKCIVHLYSPTGKSAVEGAFLKVEGDLKKLHEPFTVHAEKTSVVALNGTDVTLFCKANTSLLGCWFRHPSGFSITPSINGNSRAQYVGDGLQLGDCGIKLQLVNEDSGKWVCNVALENDDQGDRQVPISVRVTESRLTVHNESVEGFPGKEAKLLFRTTEAYQPLEYCHWMRPDGLGLTFIRNNWNRTLMDSYTYHGSGLVEGECGVQITRVRDIDFGNWTCTVRFDKTIVRAVLELPRSSDGRDVHLGGVSGAVLAVMALMVLIAALVYWKFFRVYRRASIVNEEQELVAIPRSRERSLESQLRRRTTELRLRE